MTRFALSRIALLLFFCLGLLLGTPRLHAGAQGVSSESIVTFAKPPAPALGKYMPVASATAYDYSVKNFTVDPKTAEIVVGLSLGVIVLANIRFRPRHAR